MPNPVRLSKHAIARYHERVKPTLTYRQAKSELFRLIGGGREVESIDWHEFGANESPPDYYLELSDGIALAIRGDCAFTCLIRGGQDSYHRTKRTKQHKARRRHSQNRSTVQGFQKRPYKRDRKWAA